MRSSPSLHARRRRRRRRRRSLVSSLVLEKQAHFRVGLVVVRARVGESSRSGAPEGRRGEQRAADEGGENHWRVSSFFRLILLLRRRGEKKNERSRWAARAKKENQSFSLLVETSGHVGFYTDILPPERNH